jgi:hypothetical protein
MTTVFIRVELSKFCDKDAKRKYRSSAALERAPVFARVEPDGLSMQEMQKITKKIFSLELHQTRLLLAKLPEYCLLPV